MDFEAQEQYSGTSPDYRDARIERLERERDRLRGELMETRNRFRRFAQASGTFASSMRGRISERRRLDLQHAVLDSLDRTTGPEEAAVKVLEILGHGLDRTLGAFWVVDGDTLRCAGIWRPDGAPRDELERVCRSASFSIDSVSRNGGTSGPGLPVRVRDEGRAVWVPDLREIGDPRAEEAAGEAVGGALAFPVSNSGRLLGIVEFFGPGDEAPDEGLLRTLTILGNQVAQVVERMRAEEAVRESEERLRRAVEIETVGVIFFDTEGWITGSNDAFLGMSGYERGDLAKGLLRWDEMTPPEWMPQSLQAIEEFKTTGRTTPYEKEYIRKDGSRWWGLFSAKRLDESEGVEFILDITERKRTELLLLEQKRLLELIASGCSLDECLTSLCDTVPRLNPGARACVLLADERWTFPRTSTPSDLESFGEGVKGASINELASGTCGTAVYEGRPITCADIANDEKWSKMWRDLCVAHGVLACHSTPVPSADRRPLGSFMLCFNEAREPNEWERRLSEFGAHVASIAIERDRVELALRESERRFREMVDALPSAIYTTDAEGRLTHFNPAAVEFSGRVPELGTDHWCVSWKLYHPDGTLMPHDECPMAISLTNSPYAAARV